MEKTNEELKEKLGNLVSIKSTLQNDLLSLQSQYDQEKTTINNLYERLNESESKYCREICLYRLLFGWEKINKNCLIFDFQQPKS